MKYLPIFLLAVLSACGGKEKKESNSLAGLQSQLVEKQKQSDLLKSEIQALQLKIQALDTSRVTKKTLVEIDTLSTQNFVHTIDIQSVVTGDEVINVSPKVPAAYERVYAKKGMQVVKGQVLAVLDDDVLRQSVEEIKNGIEFSQTLYDRQKALWDQKMGSEVQYLSAKNNLESLKKRLITTQQQMAMYTLRSPINGQVDEVMAKQGEMGSPGFPSIRVVNLRTLKLVANPAEAYVGKIKNGNAVEVFFTDLNKTYFTTVKAVGKVIDPLNRTFSVEMSLPATSEMRPNMLAVSKIKDYSNSKAMVVPINLIFNADTNPAIYVATLRDGNLYAEKRMIKTGLSYKNDVEVISGLKSGDMIITKGQLDINDGDQLKTSN